MSILLWVILWIISFIINLFFACYLWGWFDVDENNLSENPIGWGIVLAVIAGPIGLCFLVPITLFLPLWRKLYNRGCNTTQK